jgi:hypothetical protein
MKRYVRNNSVSIPLLETIGVYYNNKKASRDDSYFTQYSNLSTSLRAHKLKEEEELIRKICQNFDDQLTAMYWNNRVPL